MKAIIFSEGNGYGHAARDKIIAEHFGLPVMTFGKGAEYCRQKSMDFIEIPAPYIIKTVKEKVKLATDIKQVAAFFKPDVMAMITRHFKGVDAVIVDGSALGLAAVTWAGKKAIFISNDITTTVGVQGVREQKLAASLYKTILGSASSVIVPDFPPPLTITMNNLHTSVPLTFSGPLVQKVKQVSHDKKYLVTGALAPLVRPILGGSAAYGDSVDFQSCFRDAEIVIAHGGHTSIMEALSYGKPVISIVEKDYSERYNNGLGLRANDVGVVIEQSLLSPDSLDASIEYVKTLNKDRLKLYKETAKKMDPIPFIERALETISVSPLRY